MKQFPIGFPITNPISDVLNHHNHTAAVFEWLKCQFLATYHLQHRQYANYLIEYAELPTQGQQMSQLYQTA